MQFPVRLLHLLFICLCGLSVAVQAADAKPEAKAANQPRQVASIPPSYALDSPIPRPDLWQRLRQGMALPGGDHPLVAVHEQWYARHPDTLRQTVERGRLYLYFIADEVAKRGMPMEMALLPMIESAFDPRAESRRKASGLWQFIPTTGKVFGLEQNAWYDGRRDVLEATRAALGYLDKLHEMFGDWSLALAAYNCGEGCIGRAIERNRARGLGVEYQDLDLPLETRHYVPKLLAMREVIRQPERFGISLDPLPDEPYFMQVNLSWPMDAKTAARLAEMNVDELLALNPAYRRRVIHTDTPGVLLLPVDRIEVFHFNLQRTGKDKVRLEQVAAKKGEVLSRIAERFNVSLDWLKEHNVLDLRRGKLASNHNLYLPAKQASAKTETSKAKTESKPRVHTVQKGDTLYSLARLYKVDVTELKRLNNAASVLRPGDQLTIPRENG